MKCGTPSSSKIWVSGQWRSKVATHSAFTSSILCNRLNRDECRTVKMALYDRYQVAQFADHLVVMQDERAKATVAYAEVLTVELLARVVGLRSPVTPDPRLCRPLVVPVHNLDQEISPVHEGNSDTNQHMLP